MSSKQKIVHGRGLSNLNLGIFVCSFDVCQASKPFPSINYGAINEMPAACDKKEVDRLLGTVNYLGKFIPNLATVAEPIRIFLRKDTEFEWSYEQVQAFR